MSSSTGACIGEAIREYDSGLLDDRGEVLHVYTATIERLESLYRRHVDLLHQELGRVEGELNLCKNELTRRGFPVPLTEHGGKDDATLEDANEQGVRRPLGS
jgi:hypothetical protein